MIKVDDKNVLYLKFILVNSSFLLFDYSNKDIKEINTVIEDSSFIILKNNNYKIFRVDNQSNIDSKRFELLLFHIRKLINRYYTHRDLCQRMVTSPQRSRLSSRNTAALSRPQPNKYISLVMAASLVIS